MLEYKDLKVGQIYKVDPHGCDMTFACPHYKFVKITHFSVPKEVFYFQELDGEMNLTGAACSSSRHVNSCLRIDNLVPIEPMYAHISVNASDFTEMGSRITEGLGDDIARYTFPHYYKNCISLTKKTMGKFAKFFRNLSLNADDKLLIEMGLEDPTGVPTADALALSAEISYKTNRPEIINLAGQMKTEEAKSEK